MFLKRFRDESSKFDLVPSCANCRKNLLITAGPISFAPYAETHCPQQNAEISRKTIQNHCARQDFAGAIVPSPSHVGKKRKAKTAIEQGGASGQD
jgi:hypothetical protein